MSKTHRVSANMLEAAETHVNSIMARRPEMAALWQNMCCTSAISRAAGGEVSLKTDHDWIVAALLLLSGGDALIPRGDA